MSFDLKDGLKGVAVVILATLGIAGIAFVLCIAGSCLGALVGLVVGYTPYIGGMVIAGLSQLGIANANLVNIGAALGFIGGFIRSYTLNKSE